MFSSLSIQKNSRRRTADELVGTHQELDRIARRLLSRHLPRHTYFPSIKEILHFEGIRGPDGIKCKSPGIDEPIHFIFDDDHHLIDLILDHQYNLRHALADHNRERAAFEAAWLAHAITDGLTPAHHVPLDDIRKNLMSDKDLFRVFGRPIKGIIRGDNAWRALKNNWKYWGVNGYMSRHIAFEYAVILVVAVTRPQKLAPHLTKQNFQDIDLEAEFKKSLAKITSLRLYDRFGTDGLSKNLIREIKVLLLPEIIKMITLAWYSAL